jgi:hypothetical protein
LPEAMNSQAFIDEFHPGEYLVLTLLIAMLKDPRIGKLLPDIDLGALEKRKIAPKPRGTTSMFMAMNFKCSES